MPFSRPTLSDLRKQVMADINASLSGANALLRKSVLYVLAIAMAGLAFLHYGYIDWIALQAVPWTATGEYLAAWGALKNVFQKDAVPAKLTVQFTGTADTLISSGINVLRADGEAYTILESATVGGDGTAIVTVEDTVAGALGNCEIGTQLTLGTTIAGIQSTGTVTGTITTGVDTETPEAFGARVIAAFQQTPQGGDRDDYVTWALAVPGVTRAWCSPNGFGAGTVVLRFMMDVAQAAHGGFPQGTNGVSQFDQGPDGLPRDVVATGDQLTLADAIIDEQPVTALVFACAPIENSLQFTISGLSTSSSATRAAIASAVSDVLFRNGDPRAGTINLNDIEAAINSVPGTAGWLMVEVTGTVNGVVTVYPGNITGSMGELPTLGGINYV
ncbi:baseplate J/gp47 family protein [Bordetella bronchialis]|uniref:Phage baseplate protein n=1 Tax=Bordetella bronchialis TaxID=463025 RepID=A0A193FT42_9BORD|nr:baseplate J/gp47 family protein [Bordetella bronchialis]ANN70922.1 phage baseplate protein [Bordetella bronchialis]